ncbi:MAG TPA: glutamate synthase large subunit [Candidatus Sumerlaeota bacterium]|nr:glutamate synthase large subunit [Candidatus Sumerlaeota bacterium]HOR28531.1 glutamate synthase large subunit [Candidatus Sumerlaeota bacterium]
MRKQEGLYIPQYEHDACGVGFVTDLKRPASHRIIQQGLQILRNLEHRGACGCDASTGDGAGILMQVPDLFLREVAVEAGFDLPDPGHYGVGMVFLPRKVDEANYCELAFESVIRRNGLRLVGWRDVPTDNRHIGRVAREGEPAIRQIFIGRPRELKTQEDFERRLFVVRKQVEHLVDRSKIAQKPLFHIPSLSSVTLIYKGLLLADQVARYYPDLNDERMISRLALVHQRYSTNTSPTWDLAQPFRYLAHNGEINTLRGNINWMNARQSQFSTPLIEEIETLFPIIRDGQSDSACLDNALELLFQTGRSLPHCVSMLIPEAWQHHESMVEEKKAYYEYHACLMEPWDGPASIAFTDGRMIGAVLDRNGLRPSRYWATQDGLVVMASEAGVLDIPQEEVTLKGRLQPGRMFLCDLGEERIISDEEIKERLYSRQPYGQWLGENLVRVDELPNPRNFRGFAPETLPVREQLFGYTLEDMNILLAPMAIEGKEPLGSMGNDAALAVLSDKPRLLFDYFKQLFAQVTNPPLDAIREELVTSLNLYLGREDNLFDETPRHARRIKLEQPILTNSDLERLKRVKTDSHTRSRVFPILFPADDGHKGLRRALRDLCEQISRAIGEGIDIIVLTDRDCGNDMVPIPSLLAVAAIHHHLIREGTRTQASLVLESGEPREVHHFALLFGYGCSAVNPYVALDAIESLRRDGALGEISMEKAKKNYIKAINHGLLKVMSKMGISTLQSYCGAQIFEAIGLHPNVVDRYFTGTASRIEGIGLETIAEEAIRRHQKAFPPRNIPLNLKLDLGGQYQWRRDGEKHMINPFTISKLQEAVRRNSWETFSEFSRLLNEDARMRCTLRGLLTFRKSLQPVHLDEVEPAAEIVKRFCTGAMSFGSISKEAHETLAIAMNTLGGKSNTGEGGEDPERFRDNRNSAIKQVASGRFGVTINYLTSARELQIKMAQGAKPGEGGQLPGHKVDEVIGRIRHSTPGVGLISPPPHHDIYSIEDLAQLIHDLKNSNPAARISVKLVAEVGVGTVAAGVAKGKADVVLISGHDGGTGASPLTSIKHAGLPWELGLAETHQTLVMNDLRSRIVVQTDGQIKTGRDVAIAILLGAEEIGFSTAPLISMGCIMMRKCHLNTCPVGIATQDPVLRAKFSGKPEYVINYFFFVAEELRAIMADLGFRTVDEMIGRVDMLDTADAIDHWKARGLNLAPILHKPQVPAHIITRCTMSQDHGLERALDNELIRLAGPALERKERVQLELPIRNTNRTVGTMLSHEIAKRFGLDLLPDDTIHLRFRGSAGQSFGAFAARGLTLEVEGDANDYFGKGLSGARLIIYPSRKARFVAEQNVIIGNVSFYGATSGEAFIRGIAGERFCVRNSGARVVVEGVGDHGCEYMTGGRAIILGQTGRNFAAGMSGGIAYVLDERDTFPARCNKEMVDLERIEAGEEEHFVREMIQRHLDYTGSTVAAAVLADWERVRNLFVKVYPRDYKLALEERARRDEQAAFEQEPVAVK